MPELITNLHMHTRFSDGTGTHQDIAMAALESIVDVVIVTDHNVLAQGVEGYHRKNNRRILLLVGEELHDQDRQPQKNHLLAFNTNRELATYAFDTQLLIDRIQQLGGLSFIAHPIDPALPLFHEDDISWENWDVHSFTGIELWNGLSEFKHVVHNWPQALFHAYFPQTLAHGPIPGTLRIWDDLLARGQRVVAIGGSDAHQLNVRAGPFRKVIFPYTFHFNAINSHLLVDNELSGDLATDKRMIYTAFQRGNCFVGYDLPAPTRGFRFTAQGKNGLAQMGDQMILDGSATLQVRLPLKVECRLLKDGVVIKRWTDLDVCTHITDQPGIYRVECSVDYQGKSRGWIYSNPIYLIGKRNLN
jgi:hypothetical protein